MVKTLVDRFLKCTFTSFSIALIEETDVIWEVLSHFLDPGLQYETCKGLILNPIVTFQCIVGLWMYFSKCILCESNYRVKTEFGVILFL